jgi:hypothetical protein
MTRGPRVRARILVLSFAVLQLHLVAGLARADDPARRVRRSATIRRVAQPCVAPRATSTLGTFYPTPVITARGNFPVGGGYSPLEGYGDSSLTLYGPLSPMRTSTAPVLTYVRGYDGRTRLSEAISFSNPNLPVLSPVRYPTEGNYYYGPRRVRALPWGSNAINWIDQN